MRKAIAAFAVAAFVAVSPQAKADQVFDFSFNGNFGNATGTVTGQLTLNVSPDGSATATQATILSVPDFPGQNSEALQVYSDVLTLPLNIFPGNVSLNSFTVTNGQITAAHLAITNGPIPISVPNSNVDAYGATLNLVDGSENTFQLEEFTGTSFDPSAAANTTNFDGMAGITFTPVNTPEPPTLAMLGSGIVATVGFGLCRRRATPLASVIRRRAIRLWLRASSRGSGSQRKRRDLAVHTPSFSR
jgi:hypothetical protein